MKYIVSATELAYLQSKTIEAESKEEAIKKYLDANLEGEVMVNKTDIIDFNIEVMGEEIWDTKNESVPTIKN